MKIHILGICGTFMGGIALLAREHGHQVTGSDSNVYPPMSTMLAEQGVDIMQGFQSQDLPANADAIVVGNVMKRGLEVVEYMLDRNLPYISGPQWLGENILRDRWVLAVAGTHGKTTTSSMLAWILEYAGLKPGFLIGGVPENFGVSARLGDSPFFVVEADEYDTAFFDKRSKFVHYHPRTVILNNLEYDHADIFPNVEAIKTQFHHLMRTVPGSGLAVVNAQDANLRDTLAMGCWTPVETFADGDWRAEYLQADGSEFRVFCKGDEQGIVRWSLLGEHNVNNALAAIAAARHAGVPAAHAIAALAEFQGVKRRMQMRGQVRGVTVYDDFAHHPTAITTTLAGLRAKVGNARIVALLEPRSNTMRMGTHKAQLAASLQAADQVFLYQPQGLGWDLADVVDELGEKGCLLHDVDELAALVTQQAQAGDHILVMSNGGFGGIHDKLLVKLAV
ncbi:MAG TPA: UDP-N-acetylmuramate:L-alanyl-gamma-D-glutamyl-meso-diaminopimelate ligase [Candidatus Thiothrix moscowensis]|uniref:UDP-N-acetylmuramate:L-alanyl-gamma-D-glutamyl- meso-diaminopimelate ligase n=1 Tax=unclassified Thiothrix TaxID=2636184 RepID=UPI0025FD4608|nr:MULTISPECIES: UDP-N-acetylmuramate:L-alanyl-gamma-D-glutamyl-meso-diaminopimelate ligase [unclassified Thiothrix]HRJ51694.1 UDP-N-acetylmuramate:L-alanyl-gamma-D-glutamyl-meso-diaminopimelate ligase [Candidatus Thiothrix moscowensis]HRJ92009.1 UDP-N-acetylmuramate:L-alanyl-gamma-D-glutamyl-meso-diaminopimelate ligase [Candidatus Thiothrix moscowensis]